MLFQAASHLTSFLLIFLADISALNFSGIDSIFNMCYLRILLFRLISTIIFNLISLSLNGSAPSIQFLESILSFGLKSGETA